MENYREILPIPLEIVKLYLQYDFDKEWEFLHRISSIKCYFPAI
jgi:hypothetical protein